MLSAESALSQSLMNVPETGGPVVWNERRMPQEIDGLFHTSPIGHKANLLEEADTVLNIFDTTLLRWFLLVYRRFDNCVGRKCCCKSRPFAHHFSVQVADCSDRDGNPTLAVLLLAKLPRSTVYTYCRHCLATKEVSRGLTFDGIYSSFACPC